MVKWIKSWKTNVQSTYVDLSKLYADYGVAMEVSAQLEVLLERTEVVTNQKKIAN